MTQDTAVNPDEERAAEELDSLITARLEGQEVAPSDALSPQEAVFAAHLVELADSVHPDPDWLAHLDARLAHTTQPRHRQARWSFLQTMTLARRPIMFKRTAIALAGAAALAILIFLALPLYSPQEVLRPLPSLAMLSAYAQGGGTAGNSLFPGTTFVLNTALPTVPNRAVVYRRSELNGMTLDEFRRLAERFGVRGQIYRPDSSGLTLAGFTLFDGSRQLSMVGDMVTYGDRALQKTLDAAPPLAFSEATKHAQDFLQKHGLLDLPYRVESSPYAPDRVVRFVRLLNGAPIQYGEIEVVVASDGQIAAVSFRPLVLERVGDYPIRSAQAAWEQLVSGQVSDRIQYSIRREERSTSSAGRRFWYPEYRPGQRIDLYGSLIVYRPADGKGSRVLKLDDYELRGKTPALDQAGKSVHVWGTLALDGRSLEVAGWEPDSTPPFSQNVGTIHREGKLVLLRRADGKTFVLPNVPADLPDGISVDVRGRETNRTESNYPVLDWTSVLSPPNSLPTLSLYDSPPAFQGNAVVVPVRPITPTVSSGKAATPVPPTRVPSGIAGINEPYIPPGYATPPLGAGQRVQGLVGRVSANIFESADGKSRVVFAVLAEGVEQGWIAKLRGPGTTGIEKFDALHVRVWGKYVLEGDQPTIQVERYEKAYPDERIQAWLGKRELGTVEGKTVCFFKTREGERFILANEIDVGQPGGFCKNLNDWQMVMGGVVQRETRGGYRVMEMLTGHSGRVEDGWTDLKSYQMESRPQVVRPRQPLPGKASVQKVELVYYLVPIYPGSASRPADPSLLIVQPLWKFTGHTQDGASFEILVQAVADQYVK